MPFIRYEDCVVNINDKTFFATDASLSAQASVSSYRDYEGDLVGYVATQGVVGQLDVDFFLTNEFTGNYKEFNIFEIIKNPRHLDPFSNGATGSLAGVAFNNAYLKNLSFSVEPFSPIQMSTSFLLYGSLSATSNLSSSFDLAGRQEGIPANGIKSHFTATSSLGIDHPISFSYDISSDYIADYQIGDINPARVSRTNMTANMNIRGEGFGNELKFNGNDASITSQLYSVYGTEPLGSFQFEGRVTNNSLTAGANNYMQGSIALTQNYR